MRGVRLWIWAVVLGCGLVSAVAIWRTRTILASDSVPSAVPVGIAERRGSDAANGTQLAPAPPVAADARAETSAPRPGRVESADPAPAAALGPAPAAAHG